MDAAKALEWVIGRLGFVERRAERRERDGLNAGRERVEVETLQWLIGYVGSREPEAHAIAVAKEAQRERGRASTRSPETLIESLCRILECQPHEALARVEVLAAKAKQHPLSCLCTTCHPPVVELVITPAFDGPPEAAAAMVREVSEAIAAKTLGRGGGK